MTWETEDVSDVHSQSQMTTDTYGYTDAGDQNIIWSDDPENAYFRAMIQGKDEQSLLGDSTINGVMEEPPRANDSRLHNNNFSTTPDIAIIGSSGLSMYDTDAEDDTIAKIESDVDDRGWFAARRKKNKAAKKGIIQPLETSIPASEAVDPSVGHDVLYNFKSPISALSPLDKAGEGHGSSQPFAVPNPYLVPKSPGKRPVPHMDGERIITDLQEYGEDGKIIPGYIFVTQGQPSSVQTKNSPSNAKKMHTEVTPKAKSKSRFSFGRQHSTLPASKEPPIKFTKQELTVDTDESVERRRRRKLILCKIGILFLMAALIVGIAMLAIVFKSRRDANDTNQSNESLPVTNPPTMPPNFFLPSDGTPSATPTSPPGADTTTGVPTMTLTSDSTVDVATPTLDTTFEPTSNTTSPIDDIKDFLVSLFPISADALEDPSSPQFLALEWIAELIMGRRHLRGRHLQQLDARMIQRWTLAVLYFATGGDPMDNTTSISWSSESGWLQSPNECDWSFILCDDSGSVTELVVENTSLIGTIPPEIGLLADTLVKLSLNSNSLEGTIPTTIGLLSGLQVLNIQKNTISGLLPTELGNMTALQSLTMSRNVLDGTIPTQIGNLVGLRSLDLALTNLSGTIPTELARLTQLNLISLGSTKLSGTIPSELGNMPVLERLKIGRTDLGGEIPDGICSRASSFDEIRADCQEIICPCCTICCVDGEECADITATPTVAPTRPPTFKPTLAPTNEIVTATATPTTSPTLRLTPMPTPSPQVQPTLSPTAIPEVATVSPTIQRTPSPTEVSLPPAQIPTTCNPEIMVGNDCYENGDDITVVFDNCNPRGDDWIGVYAAGQDFSDLGEPIAWVWTAGDQVMQIPVASGNITFFDAQGSGIFRAVLARNLDGPPYQARAVSNEFQLTGQCP